MCATERGHTDNDGTSVPAPPTTPLPGRLGRSRDGGTRCARRHRIHGVERRRGRAKLSVADHSERMQKAREPPEHPDASKKGATQRGHTARDGNSAAPPATIRPRRRLGSGGDGGTGGECHCRIYSVGRRRRRA